MPRGMQDLSAPTGDGTWAPAVEVRRLNHWTAREVPSHALLNKILLNLFIPYSSILFNKINHPLQT